MGIPEFVYLNEQAVRISSWHRDSSTGAIEFVVIAKGEGDRDQLIDTFARAPVMVRLDDDQTTPMNVRSLETRSSGEGPRSVHRLQLVLTPADNVAPGSTPISSPPGASIDEKLDHIIDLLTEIRNEIRQRQAPA